MSFFSKVNFVSLLAHPTISTSLWYLEILFLKSLVHPLLQVTATKVSTWCHPRICGWCIRLGCARTNGVQQLVQLAPISFPDKSAGVKLPNKAQKNYPTTFPSYWWCLERNIDSVSVRLAEERRKRERNNSNFWLFQVGHLRSLYTLLLLLQIKSNSINCSMYLKMLAFVPRQWYCRVSANTLIGATILSSGPSLYIMGYTHCMSTWLNAYHC